MPGASCAPTNACRTGTTVCTGGVATCEESGDVANGTPCGEDMVCNAGACAPCAEDVACTPANPCHAGATSCTTGASTCADTGTSLPDGTACGTNMVCNAGACTPCSANVACVPANPCHTGAASCTTGASICADTGTSLPDGTACGTDMVCNAGACTPCSANVACTPANPCHVGATSCSTGSSVCVDAGMNIPDGTACGMSGAHCMAGACVAPSVISVVSGNAQTGHLDQSLAPVTIKLVDGFGVAAANVTVQVNAPPGAAAVPASPKTNAQGLATFSLRLSRQAGQHDFTISAPNAADVTVSATATAPPPGTIFALVNASHTPGNDPVPGAATVLHTGAPESVVAAADGTLYVSDRSYSCVRAVSPAGVLTTVAGICGSSGYSGDGVAATSAKLSQPYGLALDEPNARLYIADTQNQRVRVVDLVAGTISTYAGGGNAAAPGYGDGGPATAASLSNPRRVALGPDGALYISDGGHGRLRRVDPLTGIISNWLSTQCTASTAVAFVSCSNDCNVVWDAAGDAYISAYFTGSDFGQPCSSSIQAIVRRQPNGTLTRVAGKTGGSTTDGGPADSMQLSTEPLLAVDGAGNLYLATASDHRIRRIERGNGRVTTIAGTGTSGYAGDHVPSTQAQVATPTGIFVDAAQNIYFADSQNMAVRAIWAGGTTMPSVSTLTLQGGNSQSAFVDQLLPQPLSVKLTDALGAPLVGFAVKWSAVDPGGAVYGATSKTNAGGIATMPVRPGLVVGNHGFRASFQDIVDTNVAGSPVSFTATATAPPAGTTFTAINTGHSSGASGVPGAGTIAQTTRIWATVSDSAGNLYLDDIDNKQILKLSPNGHLTRFAGTTGAVGNAGDGGPATAANLIHSRSLAIDEARQRLYIGEGYPGDRVRYVDLTTGIIDLFAGSGSGGDGGLATSASLMSPGGLSVAADGAVYLVDAPEIGSLTRIRKVDFVSGIISSFITPTTNCGGPLVVNGIYGGLGSSTTAVDAANNFYFIGYACGSTVSGNVVRIMKRTPGGALSIVAGGGVMPTENTAATASSVDCPNQLIVDAAGNLYFSDACKHFVRKISPQGIISTIAGTAGTSGLSADYVPAAQTLFNSPWGVSLLPGGHLAISDSANVSLRILW